MKAPTSRQVSGELLVALFCLLGLFAGLALGGCKNLAATASNYDRDYSASYDATNRGYAAGVTIRRASRPGAGSPSLSLGVTGKDFVR